MTTFLAVAQLTNYRTCMVCEDRFHLDDGDDYMVGFVCAGCDEEHRGRVVPVAELAAVFRDMMDEGRMTMKTVTLAEFCGSD